MNLPQPPKISAQAARCAGALGLVLLATAAHAADDPAPSNPTAIERGKYIFAASDCIACHTDEKSGGGPLSGGPPLKTPFGTFFAPNITPDKTHGIGNWSEAEFRRALREGIGKEGEFLYPVFPFTSFSKLTDGDISDLYAYLMAQPPSARPNRPNEAKFPFNLRPLLLGWRILFFDGKPLQPKPEQTAEWNRGRYLSEAVGHCGECHTPRNALGGLDDSRAMAGDPKGADGQKSPNITPDLETGIGKWSMADLEDLLDSGLKPDGDYVGSGMADVTKGTGALTKSDRHALAVYIKSLPPKRATGK